MTIEFTATGRRHRGPSQDYLLKRASLDVVGPVRRKLGVWQTRAVHLVALGHRLKAHGKQGPSYAAEAEALSAALEHEREWLASRIAEVPEGVAAHGELRDTQRSLDVVASMLSEARALLDGAFYRSP